jgi:hypothetical protein
MIVEEEEMIGDSITETQDRQCIKLFAVNVGKIARFLLNLQEKNQSSVMTVLEKKGIQNQRDSTEETPEEAQEEISEETPENLITIEQCIKQFVINAERHVKFLLSLQAASQSIVANVLKRKVKTKVLINQKGNLK